MYDRNEFDLRIERHKEHVAAVNAQGWKKETRAAPAARRALAALLRAVARRLDPAASVLIPQSPVQTSGTP